MAAARKGWRGPSRGLWQRTLAPRWYVHVMPFALALLLLPAARAACEADPLEARVERLVGGPHLDAAEVARRLAPALEVPLAERPERRAWDLPADVAFDGNRLGRDNMDSLLSGEHPVVPTVYWTVHETETHVFATYHLFHPLDWSTLPRFVRVSAWHENDGENVQVVARKADGGLAVELVAAQAHGRTRFALVDGVEGFTAAPALGLDDSAEARVRLDVQGRVRVFMESGGHGLYPVTARGPEAVGGRLLVPGPARALEPEELEGAYALVSAESTFGPPQDPSDDPLMDRTFTACSPLTGPVEAPRHYDSDWLAAPGKRDSGISPYALGRSLIGSPERTWLGAFYLDPAEAWARGLGLDADADGWSLRYRLYPHEQLVTGSAASADLVRPGSP